ncbi:MAG TPA: SUMF1/EgtB/PvdO family nonheme iron enzyme, partial [Nitrosomonas sp.]|nr:SUMF1/EgtB/PvdO family nonheme iron enzyme [Nitrosomonas sp.]
MNVYPYLIGFILTLLIASNLLAVANNDSAAEAKQIQSTQTQPSQQQPQQSNLESPLQPIIIEPLGKPDDAAQAVTKRLAATCQTDPQQAPTMVIIPPGQFLMGSSPDTDADHQSDEAPQHWVTIPKPFALSRCEITVGQFRQFVQETRYQTTAETDGKGCYSWDTAQKKAIQHSSLN